MNFSRYINTSAGIVMLALGMMTMGTVLSGCLSADDVEQGTITRLRPAPPQSQISQSLSHIVLYDGNSEGGSSQPQSSASFTVNRATIGGNIMKSSNSSASFIVSGGIGRGL